MILNRITAIMRFIVTACQDRFKNQNMNTTQLSQVARHAMGKQDWATVAECARSITTLEPKNAEGFFLQGMVERVSRRVSKAEQAFKHALSLDEERYDAAVELANQYSIARRNGEAADLLNEYQGKLINSPYYLDLAGTIFTEIGMPHNALPLFRKANQLQPNVDIFQANLAACGVFLGNVEESKRLYESLLARFPNHRRNHYQLARLSKAKDYSHVDAMKNILLNSTDSKDKNIFLYYALGKELEDLEDWEESFKHYKKGGDAVCSVAKYDIKDDIRIIDKVIEVCTDSWLKQNVSTDSSESKGGKSPIFVVGLPRTGTTLTERIISSHSQVESVGETQFLQMILRKESGVESIEKMNPEMIEEAAKVAPELIAKGYQNNIDYRLGDEPFYLDKLPFNFLFLGFIAKAWPDAKIVHLGRNPMDACFSMYKQVFTWAYKFSYSLENLGEYYVAYDRLRNHWRDVLQDRLIEVEYESLVSNTEEETKALLARLGLDFEEACLNFDQNKAPSATASSVQIREKTHNRSVNKWKRFSEQLQPLKEHLMSAGIKVE